MDSQLRPTQPFNYCETENVMREAFWNHYSPGCNEDEISNKYGKNLIPNRMEKVYHADCPRISTDPVTC